MTDTRIVTAPRVRPVFQVAVGDTELTQGQARYDVARYDQAPDATYAGLDAEWTDDGCDVLDATTWLGRQRSVDVFDVGTATVTVRNPAGLWDYPPTNPTTPLSLRPGRLARVGVIVDGAAPDWLFTGWIDSTRPTYLPNAAADTVTVACVCAKGQFGRVELPALTGDIGAGETVVDRLARLADAAQFPTHRRAFDPSAVALIGTRLGGRAGELADNAATSAGGDVFGDEAGMLRYAGRDWRTRGPGDGPFDGVIGNRDLPGEVCPNEWDVEFARSDFSNRVNYGRVGEQPATIDDDANQADGVETWTMTSLETADDATMTMLAERALALRSFDYAPRIAAVRLDAARPGVIELLRAASPFTPTMYACGLVQSGRAVFARSMYLTGIEHTITASSWTARLALDDATPWQTNSNARYGTARYDADIYARAV